MLMDSERGQLLLATDLLSAKRGTFLTTRWTKDLSSKFNLPGRN